MIPFGLVALALLASRPVLSVVPSVPTSVIRQAPQGTTNCTAVTWWFADANTRLGSKSVKPILTLFSGQTDPQTAKITTHHETVAGGTATVPLQPYKRVQLDGSQLVTGEANFALIVECSGICAADLKMVGSVVVVSAGLPLCR